MGSNALKAMNWQPGTQIHGIDVLSTEESASALKKVIDGASLEDSGKFINYDGSSIPW